MTQSIFLSDLDWYGVDAWNHPVWQHRDTGVQYCLVDELYDQDDPQARLKAMERLVAYKAPGGLEKEEIIYVNQCLSKMFRNMNAI